MQAGAQGGHLQSLWSEIQQGATWSPVPISFLNFWCPTLFPDVEGFDLPHLLFGHVLSRWDFAVATVSSGVKPRSCSLNCVVSTIVVRPARGEAIVRKLSKENVSHCHCHCLLYCSKSFHCFLQN